MLKKRAGKRRGAWIVNPRQRADSPPRAARTHRWVVGLIAALAVSSSLNCAWLNQRLVPFRSKKAQKSEVHALPIVPDVDYAAALDLGNGRKLYHSERDLIYAAGDQFYPIVVRSFPRLVGLSPDGNNVAFLDPFEFEMAADLYVFDVPARTLRRLTEHRDHGSTLSIKAARWLDDRTLYYLEGYRYGTVSRGGDLWRVDVSSLSRRPIVQVMKSEGGFEEIVEFEFVPDRKMIRYVVARHDEFGSEIRNSHYCGLDGKPLP